MSHVVPPLLFRSHVIESLIPPPISYMINKFWNIKLAVSSSNPQSVQSQENDNSHNHDTNSDGHSNDPSSSTAVSTQTVKSSQTSDQTSDSPDNWRNQETYETAQTLKEKQKQMEEQVYRIWTVLSTFEESSAACISEMLRHVSSGLYLEGVRMAGKFVLHVETLFAAIDDLDVIFRSKNAQGLSLTLVVIPFLDVSFADLGTRPLFVYLYQRSYTYEKQGCFVKKSSTSSPFYHILMRPVLAK